MATQERDCAGKTKGVTPAQRLLLSAIQASRDVETGLADVSLSALQGMTDLSRRGITKALSELDGHAIERIPGGPGRQNRYRILENGAACLAQPVAINGSASQVFNPTSGLPAATGWPLEPQASVASPQLQRQPVAFSVNPSASQALDNRRSDALSHAAAKTLAAQSTEQPPEATPFVQSVGLNITPASLSILLAQPVVWQQVKQLAETILAIQPSMAGDNPATAINPSPIISEPVFGSPTNQRQTASVSVAQSAGQAARPAKAVAMSASASELVNGSPPSRYQAEFVSSVALSSPTPLSVSTSQLVAGSPPIQRQAESVSVAPSANLTESPAARPSSAAQPVVAGSTSSHQAASDSRRPSANQAMSPTNSSVRPASPPAPVSAAARMKTASQRTEPTTRSASQRPPEPAAVGHGVSTTINPGPGVPVSTSARHPAAAISSPFPGGQPAASVPGQPHPSARSALSSGIATASRAQPMSHSAAGAVPTNPIPDPRQLPPSTRPGGSKRPASAPTVIPHDWQPGERVYAWATKQGMKRDWVDDQIDEFITCWTDAGNRRQSWDATFMHRLQYLQTHQTPKKQEKTHAISHTGLADKDYDKGATPFDQIPWLNDADVP